MAVCGNKQVAGARIAVYPMRDDFADVILSAVRHSDHTGLYVSTDDLGTTVQGHTEAVFRYAEELFLRASAKGGHVVANVLFSIGCPGDVPEDFDFNASKPAVALPAEETPIACAWSLYPLGAGKQDYFQTIMAEIEKAQKTSGVTVSPCHYCTRLDGTANAVFSLLKDCFEQVSKQNSHTVIHATFSAGSPSEPGKEINQEIGA
jgi:uncharacterized protein YqgV (UPF0045/DUF77 family)